MAKVSYPDYDLVPIYEFITHRATRKHPKKLIIPEHVDILPSPSKKKNSNRGNIYKNTKTGFSLMLNHVIRSMWEYHFALVLKSYDILYEFEPKLFTYPVKRGNKGYVPDFYLPKTDEFVELKGYLDSNSAVKLHRFKTHYPDEFSRFTIIISKHSKKNITFCTNLGIPRILFYEDLRTLYKDSITSWEKFI